MQGLRSVPCFECPLVWGDLMTIGAVSTGKVLHMAARDIHKARALRAAASVAGGHTATVADQPRVTTGVQ